MDKFTKFIVDLFAAQLSFCDDATVGKWEAQQRKWEKLAGSVYKSAKTYVNAMDATKLIDQKFAIYAMQKVTSNARCIASKTTIGLDQYTAYMLRESVESGQFVKNHDSMDKMARDLTKSSGTVSTQFSSSAQALLALGACEIDRTQHVVTFNEKSPVIKALRALQA